MGLLLYLFGRRIVHISLESGLVIEKGFRWTRDGVEYKLGKYKYHVAIRPQEVRRLGGKWLVDVGYPSGLPLNIQLAMLNPKNIDEEIERRTRDRYNNMVAAASINIEKLTDEQKRILDNIMPALKEIRETKVSKEQAQAMYNQIRGEELAKFIAETTPQNVNVGAWYAYLGTYKNLSREELYTRERENAAYWRGKRAGSDLISKAITFIIVLIGGAVGIYAFSIVAKALGA